LFAYFIEKLFLQTNIVYNPESDPLEQFPTDQLNRLNPKILIEITKLQALNIQVEGNSHPPCIDDMESYATCLDAGEWNTSCHLKLTYLDKARYLPCELPEFYIRLTPDYLQTGQLNWYYLPKLKFLSSLNNPNKDNVNHLENSERYLNLYYDELNKQFDRMKQLTDHRKSLVKIGKTWVSVNLFTSVICASMARFYKFDHNLLIITTIKSTQQNSQLVY
uniref:Karyogamy protein 5 n=1 Tax=Schistosoma curassoni TaxID=6186 RepID=A0A183KJ56_9TREM